MEAAVNAVRPGVSEREIAAEAEYVMRKNGSEGTGISGFAAISSCKFICKFPGF